MSDMSRQTPAKRAPDCVTKIRKGNTILTVSGYFKQDATETAADKMEKAIHAESMAETLHKKSVN